MPPPTTCTLSGRVSAERNAIIRSYWQRPDPKRWIEAVPTGDYGSMTRAIARAVDIKPISSSLR